MPAASGAVDPSDGELPDWADIAASLSDTQPPREELTALRADFPQFRIWREMTLDRIRYVSHRLHQDLHPHTVITEDPRELRTILQAAQNPAR